MRPPLFKQRRERQMARAIALHPVKADERAGIQTAIDLHHLRCLCQIKPNGQAAARWRLRAAWRSPRQTDRRGAARSSIRRTCVRERKAARPKESFMQSSPSHILHCMSTRRRRCRERGMRLIYLDNAATSFPKPHCTVQAMADALETSRGKSGTRGAQAFAGGGADYRNMQAAYRRDAGRGGRKPRRFCAKHD